jgi:hypothetical protein
MIGWPIGLAGGISLVRGGSLKPVEDPENSFIPVPPPAKHKHAPAVSE